MINRITLIQTACNNFIYNENRASFKLLKKLIDCKISYFQQMDQVPNQILYSPIVGREQFPEKLKLRGEIPAALTDEIEQMMAQNDERLTPNSNGVFHQFNVQLQLFRLETKVRVTSCNPC